jgi:hypothetical protein
LQPGLKFGVTADSHTERLSYLAAHVLSFDSNSRVLQENGVWGRTFLQLSSQVECVKAAAAAFGAAYESSLNNALAESPHSPWRYYGLALAKLKLDIVNETAGPESLVLASMILACVEIISQHEENALVHFSGAVQILVKTYQRRQEAPSADMLRTIQDELVRLHVLIGSYAMSQNPASRYLEPPEAAAGDDSFREPELAIRAAILCLRQSYQFVDVAHQLRYKYPSWREHDPIMCKGQSDVVTQCHSVLDGLAALATRLQAQATSTLPGSETLAEIYALRSQLTATMIFLLCVHSPFETGYDEHQDLFRTIVSDAAASARLRRGSKRSAFKRFSTRPGIVCPLFFVSMKCRDPSLRALATTMLREQNRDGPADGQISAAIGTRLAALETSASAPSSPGAPLAAPDVPEGQRVYGYGVQPIRLDGHGRRVVDVEFTRPRLPLVQGWGHVDYSYQANWIFWSEPIII